MKYPFLSIHTKPNLCKILPSSVKIIIFLYQCLASFTLAILPDRMMIKFNDGGFGNWIKKKTYAFPEICKIG
ncbi:hypothetical protein AOB46_02855 [Chryseobacterium indologenes]|uniref:Uncharacterized protein n=1 Tax=Chryseobacterium indologenes TaxID=253 RepID=A0A0N0IYB2_CHRID|nr:hypothetical protein AOB46_02855 [Chryseobacterium indologenes]